MTEENEGPKVTLDHIRAAIEEINYLHIDNSTLTICILKLKNGIEVVGESACVSQENYNREFGEQLALDSAIDKCWPMFGFHLASVLTGWTMDS